MTHSRRISVAAASALALGAVTLSACGGAGTVDVENGKAVFSKNCAGCHALADAGSKADPAKLGPNLDDAFRGPRKEGFKTSEFESLVKYWIEKAPQKPDRTSPQGVDARPAMKRDIVTGQDKADVAAYIAKFAGTDDASAVIAIPPKPASGEGAPAPATGEAPAPAEGGDAAAGRSIFDANCSGCHANGGTEAGVGPKLAGAGLAHDRIADQVTNGGGGMPPFGSLPKADYENVVAYVESIQGGATGSAPPPGPAPGAATSGGAVAVTADAAGQLKFDQASLDAAAGDVTFTFTNPSAVPHNFAIRGPGIASPITSKTVQDGGSDSIKVSLKPGVYEYFCAVDGHADGGMKGKLFVTDASPEGQASASAKAPRIVGPWVSAEFRDRRISRLKPAVRAKSSAIDRYSLPGYWIRINP